MCAKACLVRPCLDQSVRRVLRRAGETPVVIGYGFTVHVSTLERESVEQKEGKRAGRSILARDQR